MVEQGIVVLSGIQSQIVEHLAHVRRQGRPADDALFGFRVDEWQADLVGVKVQQGVAFLSVFRNQLLKVPFFSPSITIFFERSVVEMRGFGRVAEVVIVLELIS